MKTTIDAESPRTAASAPQPLPETDAVRDADRRHDALRKYCFSLTESPWDAEDLVQETWLRALSSGSRFGDHPNPEAYLLRTAKNAWIDRSRREMRMTRILKTLREDARSVEPDEGDLELEAAFRALTERLAPLQRAVFLLRDVLGYSSAETAAKLGTTEGAVKAALHRARGNLPLVREDLEGVLPRSEEEPGLKAYLRAIANAYRSGDAQAVVELALRIEAEPAAAIGSAHARRLRAAALPRRTEARGPVMSLAA
ncbi:RNA polymerase sigma factor [Paenibacillaceae bacterium WGS1546]|uniref:RNA polymerase sigma factor n=1 Tax=Cohnella sp. WGS1546 TaxID=3366810 RepID=UPI00372CF05C